MNPPPMQPVFPRIFLLRTPRPRDFLWSLMLRRIPFLLVLPLLLASCATKDNGQKENFMEMLQRVENSMNNTEDRLQSKTYND